MEFYIRTQEGETRNVETLKEGLERLVGKNGYRLTISDGPTELVIRCGPFKPDVHIDTQLECDNANVVIKGL